MPPSGEALGAALRRVEQFCEQRTPADARDEMRLEAEAKGTKITLVEHRAPWNPAFGSEWSRQAIAELRHDDTTTRGPCTGRDIPGGGNGTRICRPPEMSGRC